MSAPPPCTDRAVYNPVYTTPSTLYPAQSPSGLPTTPNPYGGQSIDCAQRQQLAQKQREAEQRYATLARKYRM